MRQEILDKKKKLLVRICIIFSLAIVAIILWIVIFKNGALLKTYKNDDIKFNYDKTWKLNKIDNDVVALTHKTGAIIEIKVNKLSSNLINSSIDQIKEEVRYDIEKQNSDYKLLNQEKKYISKNQYEGYKLLYETQYDNDNAESMIIIIRNNNDLCVVNFTSKYEYFDILLDSFQEVFGTIEFRR